MQVKVRCQILQTAATLKSTTGANHSMRSLWMCTCPMARQVKCSTWRWLKSDALWRSRMARQFWKVIGTSRSSWKIRHGVSRLTHKVARFSSWIWRRWLGKTGGIACSRATRRSTRRRLNQRIASWVIWITRHAPSSKRWCSTSSRNRRDCQRRRSWTSDPSWRRSWKRTQKWTSVRPNSADLTRMFEKRISVCIQEFSRIIKLKGWDKEMEDRVEQFYLFCHSSYIQCQLEIKSLNGPLLRNKRIHSIQHNHFMRVLTQVLR